MRDPWTETTWSFFDHLAGWLMLGVGAFILATAALAPDWRAVQQLARHRDLMKLQTEAIVDQAEAYRRFHSALEDRDPILLRRLACDQLRLKPAGTSLLAAQPDPTSLDPFSVADGGVAAWLHQPMAVALETSASQPWPLGHTLRALTAGPARLGLIGCGTVCMAIGLLLPLGPRKMAA